MKKHLDIVTPCYNEEKCVALFYNEVSSVLSAVEGYTFTFYLVDDGSSDYTLAEIKKLADFHGQEKVKYISLSRNFGKEAAIYAGLRATTGDLVVLMDADLQHPPNTIPNMIEVISEGYDSCATYRKKRKGEPLLRTVFSKGFYWLFSRMSDVKIYQSVMDFRMMTRKMVDAVISLSERERFTKGLFEWVGFKTKLIACQSVPREIGKSTWKLKSLFGYAISGIVSFSTAPLRFATFIGFLVLIAGFAYMIHNLIGAIFFGIAGGGFVTITTLILFIGGIIIMLLGIIGEYIARIYIETKRRPIFIVSETNVVQIDKNKEEKL
ncbi:MAG: glycosyltransferase family 2 protein [Oscillospiraceae bacterium]|nr:glycosyltransferase family 2 protein [Oscillospiraceae bacterium]MCL2278288.1 glycosyltransferase family 2 protein [Oscillospiraceae bacterium]